MKRMTLFSSLAQIAKLSSLDLTQDLGPATLVGKIVLEVSVVISFEEDETVVEKTRTEKRNKKVNRFFIFFLFSLRNKWENHYEDF